MLERFSERAVHEDDPFAPEITIELSTEAEMRASIQEVERLKQEGKWTSSVKYHKLGPSLETVLENAEQRKSPLYSWHHPGTAFEERIEHDLPLQLIETTEGQALQELDRFLDTILKKAIEVEARIDPPASRGRYQEKKSAEERARSKEEASEIKEWVERFRKEFIFIGEKEYQEACQGIARELMKELEKGKDVYLYSYQKERSPAFVETKVVEELEKIVGEKKEVLRKLHVGSDQFAIAEKVSSQRPEEVVIASVDDMIISGTKIRSSYIPAKSLVNRGWSPEDANRVTHVYAIAAPERDALEERLPFRAKLGETEFAPHLFAYYKFRGNTHDVSVSTVHARADYGFQTSLDRALKFFREHSGERFFGPERYVGERLEMPALHGFIKPYVAPDDSHPIFSVERGDGSRKGRGYEEVFKKAKDRYEAYQQQRQRYAETYP